MECIEGERPITGLVREYFGLTTSDFQDTSVDAEYPVVNHDRKR